MRVRGKCCGDPTLPARPAHVHGRTVRGECCGDPTLPRSLPGQRRGVVLRALAGRSARGQDAVDRRLRACEGVIVRPRSPRTANARLPHGRRRFRGAAVSPVDPRARRPCHSSGCGQSPRCTLMKPEARSQRCAGRLPERRSLAAHCRFVPPRRVPARESGMVSPESADRKRIRIAANAGEALAPSGCVYRSTHQVRTPRARR